MNRMFIFLLLVLTLTMTGCGTKSPVSTDPSQVKYQGYDAYVYHGESSADAKYIRFRRANGVDEFTLELPKGLPRLVVEYEAKLAAGKLIFKVIDPKGKAIIGGISDDSGHLKLYHSLRVPAGTYTIRTEYRQAQNGEVRYTLYGYYR